MEWGRLLIAVYYGRIISLKVITLSSGPRRLHFDTTGKKWAFHVVDTRWERMDHSTEPLIGVRRSWLLSGRSERSGLEEVRVYGLAKIICSLPLERVMRWPHRETLKEKKTRLGYLKPPRFLQSVSPPLYIRSSYTHICLIWRSASLIRMGSAGSITHRHLYPSVMPLPRLRWQCFPHAMCRC